MSPAAGAVLRALISRSDVAKNRFLLIEVNSVDWRSLTFDGERHRMIVKIAGPESSQLADKLCRGLEDADLSAHGAVVVDIAMVARSAVADGGTELTIEALTIADD